MDLVVSCWLKNAQLSKNLLESSRQQGPPRQSFDTTHLAHLHLSILVWQNWKGGVLITVGARGNGPRGSIDNHDVVISACWRNIPSLVRTWIQLAAILGQCGCKDHVYRRIDSLAVERGVWARTSVKKIKDSPSFNVLDDVVVRSSVWKEFFCFTPGKESERRCGEECSESSHGREVHVDWKNEMGSSNR